MSVFIYGGVELPFPFHTDLRQEAVYDDLSNTDRILTKFDVKVQSLVNFDYIKQLAVQLDPGITINPADIMNAIRDRLLTPRLRLQIRCNNVDLIPGPQGTNVGTVDAANGPIPQMCQITELGNTTFMISYHIIANYWLNALVSDTAQNTNSVSGITSNQNATDVLYNRWTETVDIDNCNYSTRTREGKFVIRSDNIDGVVADQLRTQMAIVGVPPGFLRQSSRYQVDPNGLGIKYHVVDKEVYRLPPKPAFEAQGKMTTKNTWPYAKLIAEASLRLRADKKTPQGDLVNAAVLILAKKLNLPGSKAAQQSTATKFSIPLSTSLSINMYDNEVEAHATAWYQPGSNAGGTGRWQSIWGHDYKKLLDPPDDNGGGPNYLPAYKLRGTANLLLQAAAYYDPNLLSQVAVGPQGVGATLNQSTGQMTGGLQPGQAGQTLEESGVVGTSTGPFASNDNPDITSPSSGGLLQVQEGAVTPDDTDAKYEIKSSPNSIWVDYQINNKYESDKHIYMMSISSPQGFNPQGQQAPINPSGPTIVNNQGTPTVAFVQLASPTILWICDWTAAKMDEQPEIPDPNNTFDSGWVLLDEHYEPVSVFTVANGVTALYRISGTYIYGHKNPSQQVIQQIAFGRPPWIKDTLDNGRSMPNTTLTQNLADFGGGSPPQPAGGVPPGGFIGGP